MSEPTNEQKTSASSSASTPSDTPKKKKRGKRIVITLLTVVAVWLLGDFSYDQAVKYRIAKWESTIGRDKDGVRIGCKEYSIGEGSTALLLIHGINDSPEAYRKMAPRFAEKGFHVRVMRLPGFAETIENYSKSKSSDWKAAVAKEVKQLRKNHQQVCIVAHSLGGAITIDYVLENPNSVDSVALLAPAAGVSGSRSPLLPPRAWHSIANRLLVFTEITESPFDRDARDPAERKSEFRTPFTPRHMFDQTFAMMDRNKARADKFDTPVLIAFSKDDRVNSLLASRKFFDRVKSDPKKWVDVPNAGHQLMVDYGWDKLTDEIAEFFRG